MRISVREIELLKALAAGEEKYVSSSHRLRLEMLGLVVDGPNGLYLTRIGREASEATVPPEPFGDLTVTFNGGEAHNGGETERMYFPKNDLFALARRTRVAFPSH